MNEETAIYAKAIEAEQAKVEGSITLLIRGTDLDTITGMVEGEKFRSAMCGAVATAAFCHRDSQGLWPNCSRGDGPMEPYDFDGPKWLNTSESQNFPVVITGIQVQGGDDRRLSEGDNSDRRLVGFQEGLGNVHVYFWLLSASQQIAIDRLQALQEIATDVIEKWMQSTNAFDERPVGAAAGYSGTGVIPEYPECGHCYKHHVNEVADQPGNCKPVLCSDDPARFEDEGIIAKRKALCENATGYWDDSLQMKCAFEDDTSYTWCSPIPGSYNGDNPCLGEPSSMLAGWIMKALTVAGHAGLWVDVQVFEVEFYQTWSVGGSRGLFSVVTFATAVIVSLAVAVLNTGRATP
jgi:hypothetical protein